MSTTTKSAIQTASLYSLEKIRELSGATAPRDAVQADGRAVTVGASSATRSVAQIDQLSRLAYSRAAPSTDSRYVKFVEAVRALRVDLDLSSLSKAQIDRILESAARMYLVNDGIPEPVEPLPMTPDAPPHLPPDDQAMASGAADAAIPTATPADDDSAVDFRTPSADRAGDPGRPDVEGPFEQDDLAVPGRDTGDRHRAEGREASQGGEAAGKRDAAARYGDTGFDGAAA